MVALKTVKMEMNEIWSLAWGSSLQGVAARVGEGAVHAAWSYKLVILIL